MEQAEWDELDLLGEDAKNYEENNPRLIELLKKTQEEKEHPEGYDGPCGCQMCMEYGLD